MIAPSAGLILIVDDHEVNRYTSGRILREAGYEISEAANGQQALEMAEALPDLILLDVNLPDIDGFRVCRELRSRPRTARIPIIHASATFVSDHDRAHGLEEGADGYLTRPVEPRVLTASVRACLRARRAEETVWRRERELQTLADNSPDLLSRFDRQGRHLFVNTAVERISGRRADELLGKTGRELGMPDDFCDLWESAIKAVFDTGKSRDIDFQYTLDGDRRFFSTRLVPELDVEGKVERVLTVTRDTTEKHRAELALRESESKFRTLANSIPQLAWMARPDGYVFWYNRRWLEYTGVAMEQMIDKGWQPFTDPGEYPRISAKIKEHFQSGEAWEDTFQLRRHDGSRRWFLSRMHPDRDEAGRICLWFGTNTDIEEMRQLETELRQVALDLEEANKRQFRFLATLAHELRNPLAPVRTGLELMRLSPGLPMIVEDARGMMERQIHHMVRLIDDLLDLSRITQGKLHLRKSRVELGTVIRNAVEAVQPFIDHGGHRLEVRLPSEPMPTQSDPSRLVQVFSNILGNAAKYTKEPGLIQLSAEAEGSKAVVRVRDSGQGIPPEMQKRIFDMFVQIERPGETEYSGLGIGLTLVRQILQLHGGTIEVRSEGTNQGTEFTVRLPLLPKGSAETPPAEAPEAVAPVRAHRVLVVDDNRDAAESLGIILEMMGNEVALAYDGVEAIERAEKFRPTVILMDLGMPRLDGYKAARKIRDHSWSNGMTLVALTGWGQDADKQRTKDAGFDHHLTKPAKALQIQELLATVR